MTATATPTATTAYVDNILDIYERATDKEYAHGMVWYNRANAIAWELDHLNFKRGAGVLAALSPLLSWTKNVEYAGLVYAGADIADIPCLKKNAAKAIAIKNGWHVLDHLSGPKVVSFYNNIIDPWSDDPAHVTIDKHAFDIAIGDMENPYKNGKSVTAALYPVMRSAYVTAAREVGIRPLQIQAITWEAWRNMKNGR